MDINTKKRKVKENTLIIYNLLLSTVSLQFWWLKVKHPFRRAPLRLPPETVRLSATRTAASMSAWPPELRQDANITQGWQPEPRAEVNQEPKHDLFQLI